MQNTHTYNLVYCYGETFRVRHGKSFVEVVVKKYRLSVQLLQFMLTIDNNTWIDVNFDRKKCCNRPLLFGYKPLVTSHVLNLLLKVYFIMMVG